MTNTYVHAITGASSGGGGSTTLTGDVTGTGTGTVATTIAANAVTYSKIQTVAANKLLGNPTGSAAIPSEITLGSGLSFAGSTLNSSGSVPTLTAGSVAFSDGSTITQDNTNFFYDSSTIGLSVGPGPHPATTAVLALTSPTSDTRTTLSVFSTSSNNAVQFQNQNGFTLAGLCASATNSPSINLERARGTLASKTQALSGDILGSVVFNGYTGSADGSFAAALGAVATENQSSGHAGAQLVFQTCPNGSATLVPRMVINQNGLVTVANLTPSRVVVSDASDNLVSSATTAIELGYVSGVTSPIQTQLNALSPAQAPSVNQLYYVSAQGNDTTGDGTYNKPFATIKKAMDLITDATSTKIYFIKVLGTRLQEPTNIILKGNVYIVGEHSGGSYVRINGGAGSIIPDPTTTVSARCGIQDIYFGGGTSLNWDLFTNGPNTGTPSCVLILVNVSITGTFTYKGRTPTIDFLQIYNSYLFGNISLDACINYSIGTTYQGATTISAQNGGSDNQYSGGFFLGGLTLTSTATYTNQVQLSACSITGGALTITDAASLITLISDSSSYPKHAEISVTGTPTITLLNDAYGVGYTPAVPGNWVVPPTTIQEALDMIAAKIGPV